MSIEKIRKEIDKTDLEIAKLLKKRFELSVDAAAAKGKLSRDENREREIVERLKLAVPEDMAENVENVYAKLLAQSRQYQKKKLQKDKR